MKKLVLSTTLAFGIAVLPSFLSAEDWPNFQGPTRLGISGETGLKLSGWGSDGPPILWEKKLNVGFGGAAMVGDEVFLVDRDPGERDKLLCLDLADGSEKWSFVHDHEGKLSFPGSRGVPLVTEEAVFFVGGFGHIHRINRKTRQADWMVDIQGKYGAEPPRWGWAQSPVIVQDVLVVPIMSDQAGLGGFDPATGEELWKTGPFGNSHSTPAVMTLHGIEQVVFLATSRNGNEGVGAAISVEPKTGKVLWETNEYFNKIPITFPVKVSEDRVFLTGGYGNGSVMMRVTKDGGEWKAEKLFAMTQGTQVHPPFVIDGHIYMLANENENHNGQKRDTGGLMCFDLDGNIRWNTGASPFMGRGNLIEVEGKFLIQDGEVGYLRVVDPNPKEYRQLAEADIFGKKKEIEETLAKQTNRAVKKMPDYKFWSPMALSNGRLIMRGQETLKCVDLRG